VPRSTPDIPGILRQYWGFDTLRPLQAEAIDAALSGRDSLVVLPTGGGKSLCYQVPPLVTGKLTVVVSPLIALMNDQVAGLSLAGYPAAAFHSNISAEQAGDARRRARAGELKLLFTAPERLLGESFLAFLANLPGGVGAFAVDEAHCISQWGHDFRPEYRRLAELREIFPGVPIHAYTATATPRVREDIAHQLALADPAVLVGNFDRPNLTYRVRGKQRAGDQVFDIVSRHTEQASIVYCLSRKDTEAMAASLKARGLDAEPYHAGMDARKRARVAEDFRLERTSVVCATVAFGMGIDRGDVRCVVHAAIPSSVEAYQQETGRAGRDGLPAECVLLYSPADLVRRKQLMERSRAEADPPMPEEVFEAQTSLLRQMGRLAGGARCRHRALVEYFGQRFESGEGGGSAGGCGACDVCLGELPRVPDDLDAARKVVSCIARLRAGFGASYVADLLCGKPSEKAEARGHTSLSTFGLLRQCTKDAVVGYIEQLVDAGALVRSDDQFATVTLGPRAQGVLKQEVRVELFDPAPAGDAVEVGVRSKSKTRASAAAGTPLSSEESALFESMRRLRRKLADDLGVPPFVVFADTVLDQLARLRPGTLDAMRRVKGIGAAKLSQFGERFLELILAESRERGLALDAEPGAAAPPSSRAASKPATQRANASLAFPMFARGESVEDVAKALGVAAATAHDYLADFISRERPSDISVWVDDATYRTVADAARAGFTGRLKPIHERLGGSIGYDPIRAVVRHLIATGELAEPARDEGE
jgi:ATP-dependent DNA helicase RecQ